MMRVVISVGVTIMCMAGATESTDTGDDDSSVALQCVGHFWRFNLP